MRGRDAPLRGARARMSFEGAHRCDPCGCARDVWCLPHSRQACGREHPCGPHVARLMQGREPVVRRLAPNVTSFDALHPAIAGARSARRGIILKRMGRFDDALAHFPRLVPSPSNALDVGCFCGGGANPSCLFAGDARSPERTRLDETVRWPSMLHRRHPDWPSDAQGMKQIPCRTWLLIEAWKSPTAIGSWAKSAHSRPRPSVADQNL